MNNESELIIAYLNELLSVNYKSEKIFLEVLDEVDSMALKNFFSMAAYERNSFIKSLDKKIRKKGSVPTYPEVLLNSKNLISSNLHAIIFSRDEQLLLTEIGRIHIMDIEKYKKILNDFEFSDSIEKLLKSQQNTIVKALYSIEVHKHLLAKDAASF